MFAHSTSMAQQLSSILDIENTHCKYGQIR